MASAAEAESLLSELLRSGGDGLRGALGLLHPILMDLTGPRPAYGGETEAQPPVRIVLMNPRTGRVVVLYSDASFISEFLMEEGGRCGPPPASKASIEAMRKLNPAELEPGHECPVCLVVIVGGVEREQETVREMPCKHRFHEGCINKWLGMHGSCPVCRFQMPVEEEVANKSEEPPREEEGVEEHQPPRMIMNIYISMHSAAGLQQPDDDNHEEQQQEQRTENID